MRILAGRVGQLVNMAGISSEIGISIPTVKEWISVLERSDQVLLLQPYFGNISKRLIKTPKVYFLDTGLAAHLLKWEDPRTTLAGPMAGQLFNSVPESYTHSHTTEKLSAYDLTAHRP